MKIYYDFYGEDYVKEVDSDEICDVICKKICENAKIEMTNEIAKMLKDNFSEAIDEMKDDFYDDIKKAFYTSAIEEFSEMKEAEASDEIEERNYFRSVM